VNILVTGASGFLGTTLCARLETDGHSLECLSSRDCDLTEATSLARYNHRAYDEVYHLAAWTQAGDFCLHHPGEQWLINQQINTNVLRWWQRDQPQAKMICIGTSCAYPPDQELVEENYLRGTPIESLFTYAMTKRMLYAGVLALHQQYGLKYLCVVPSTLYGPRYRTDGRQMHFIFDLIRKILRGKLYGERVTLWGDGQQRREVVYLDDFVSALLGLRQRESDLVNIGAGEEFTIRHFATLICQIVGFDAGAIEYDTARYVGARSKCLGIDKLRSLLPDLRLTSLETGLRRTIEWFLAEHTRLQ